MEGQRHISLPVPKVMPAKFASRLGLLLVHFFATVHNFDLNNNLKCWHLEGKFAEGLRCFSHYLAIVKYDVT